jgi:hypothetical protein
MDEWKKLPQREAAWQARDRIAAYRKQLLAAGYRPLCCNGKTPPIPGWQDILATPAVISKWPDQYPDAKNTGILTRDAPAVDIDVTDEEVAEEIEVLAEDLLGKTAVRVGRAPKRALLYRTDLPFPKLSTGVFTSPSGHRHKVEILCDGQHVVDGTHPDTKQPYRWHSGEPGPSLKREDLPLLTAEKAAGFIAAVKELMTNRRWTPAETKKDRKLNGNKTKDEIRTEDASIRERAYAQAALDGCTEELAGTPEGSRNDTLNKKAFRLGTMVARGWLDRVEVEEALLKAATACGLKEAEAAKTTRSGIEAGTQVPHPDLDDGAKQEGWEDPNSKPPRFPLITFSELRPTLSRDYLVKGILPRNGLVPVWGPPKCGKSFWISDLALHVALGWEYRGHKVVQGTVIYCAFEGAAGFKKRAPAFRQRHGIPDDQAVSFYLQPLRMDLVKDHKALIQSIRAHIGDVNPVIVVLDTLNRSLVGSESKDEDMSAYVNAADAIREAFGCAVAIIHHCGIDGTRPRGHTSLTGTAEAQISVKRDEKGTIIATVEYMKDGEEGEVIASRLEQVEVGQDEDGEVLTSCIVVPTDTPKAAKGDKPKTLTRAGKIALRALAEALDQAGTLNSDGSHIPAGVRVTTKDMWRRYAYQAGISDSEEPSARRKAFVRGYEAVVADGLVHVWGEQVWMPLQKEKPP